MGENNRIIGIELGVLEEIIRSIVRQEMAGLREEIKQILISTLKSIKGINGQ